MTLSLSRSQTTSAIGYLIITCGCLNLAGWQFDIVLLKSLLPGITPINPVSSCTFIACGAWLLLFTKKRWQTLLLIVCGAVTLTGVIHLAAYFTPLNIRFDQLLFREKIMQGKISNLIAPNTALLFILAGISMCKAASKIRWVLVMRQVFLFAGVSLVYFSLLGYIYHIPPGYQLAGYTPMSLVSALLFGLLYIGLFLSNVELGMSRVFFSSLRGSRLLRSSLIITLVLPPITGYFRLLGERKGLYPAAVGVEINTLIFTSVVLVLIVMYALAENRRQLADIRSKLQLAASELKFRTIFQSLKEGVACLDFNGRCLYCNTSYCDITGYAEHELLGQVVIEKIIPASERPVFYELLAERRQGKEQDYQTNIVKKNGERIWIDVKSRTMKDNDGNAYGYLVSMTDITEERMKVEDLKAFSGSAAHDLNSPLGRIINLSDFLGAGTLTEKERKTFLEGILETAYSMRQLLQDLLTFSKLGSGQLDKREVNISDIVQNICKSLTPKDFKGEINIDALPAVNGNEGAIRQLFTNLISNAIKYSSKKDFTRVEIGAVRHGNLIIYYIKDNGVGLTTEQIATLFTPFKRYHSDFEGNGLGLAIVKRVIEKHAGKIWAESVPGDGLTFHFTLSPERASDS